MAFYNAAGGTGNAPIVTAFIEAKVDVNRFDNVGRDALSYAAGAGKPETVQLLLNAKAPT